MALSDFYASHPHYKTRLHLSVRNSNATVVGAALAESKFQSAAKSYVGFVHRPKSSLPVQTVFGWISQSH
ncbi:hypothetical protein LguiB_005565 [Lonicera macranthoides]